MQVEILISTMNKRSISDLKLSEKNIKNNCTIINQVTDDNLDLINEEIKEKNIRMFSYREKGLAKSRNRALMLSKGDIIILTDDDISLFENTIDIITEKFKQNEQFDILTFKYERKNQNKHKKYRKKEFIHNYNSARRICSVEIVMRRSSIIKNKLKYDEQFGLGARYNSGEENIFLKDCLDNGLKLKFIPLSIVMHPLESLSAPYLWSEDYLKGKGALFYRLYKNKSYFYIILLIFLKRKRIKNIGILKSFKIVFKEIRRYKKDKNEKKI